MRKRKRESKKKDNQKTKTWADKQSSDRVFRKDREKEEKYVCVCVCVCVLIWVVVPPILYQSAARDRQTNKGKGFFFNIYPICMCVLVCCLGLM
jgi:hypothetical protein